MSASVREQIGAAQRALIRAGLSSAEAALDAEVLARHVLGWDRAQLLTRRHLAAPDTFPCAFRDAIGRRAAREPVALITGHREFWSLDFEVTRDVLIPRPETELVVQEAIAGCRNQSPRVIADVGTGSGCIAIAIAVELPAARVLAIDLSASALTVASRNVTRHGLDARVKLLRANLLDAVAGPVDLIVSNPPYIPRREWSSLQPEIVRWEPESALFADQDGLAIIRALCESAATRLAPGGRLIVEFGFGQEAALRVLGASNGWSIETTRDLAGIARVAVLSRR